MLCKSIISVHVDAYRAGTEIGTVLRDIRPEVIILFASISYETEFPDFFDGLYDSLGSRDIPVFGGTGDGVYETSGASHYGVSAMGLNSEGRIRWSVAAETGVGADSHAAARTCAQKVFDQTGGKPDFVFVLADGIRADGSLIVSGTGSVLNKPFFGGLTGDDRKFTRSLILLNGEVIQDAVAILAASGDLSFVMNAASGWTPTGDIGRVEDCRCNVVKRISGLSARSFMKEQLGKPLGQDDLGIIPLAIYHEEDDEHFYLRTPSRFDPSSGEMTTFGSIEKGTLVRVCTATREEVIGGVKKAVDGLYPAGFKPSAALVVSCAGRKWLMDDKGNEEVEQVFSSLGEKLPLVGFPSFGEISPFISPGGAYTRTYFHNVTFAVCLLR